MTNLVFLSEAKQSQKGRKEMKVLYLINHAGKAGTEAYVRLLAERMHGRLTEASLVYNEEGILSAGMRELGITVYRLKMSNPFDLAAAFRLSRICRNAGTEIIHTQFLRENYIALISRIFNPRVKVLYTNHFILSNNIILRFCNRILTKLQAGIIAVCGKGKEMLIRNGNDPGKISVIYNGVDPAKWGGSPDERRHSSLRSELGLGDDIFLILCGSRFAYDKGHDFLIRSAAELAEIKEENAGIPEFRFVLANDGPFLDSTKKLALEMGIKDLIFFIGPRKDMKNVYDSCDMYVNSSAHEALSFAIVEALAEGLPVVATNVGGNPEIISDETKCGILVPYGDHKKMAAAIWSVMKDEHLREELSLNALKTVREKFSLDKMTAETYNQYVKITRRLQL
ncbi:MAG: glycosyltransferase [Eubacteriales bacterium]|nr:glycosyltransferase [Eubacteriales bacterium]